MALTDNAQNRDERWIMSTVEPHFQLEILGPRPQDVPASDLADFIQYFDVAIRAELSVADPGTGVEKQSRTDEPTISLIAISEGSDRLHFAVAVRAIPAISRISQSLASQSFQSLARSTWQALYEMSQITKRRSWGLRVCGNPALSIQEAVVPAGSEVPPPEDLPAITGITSLRARVIRAGGAKPKAELRVPNRSSLLYVDVSEADARFLGQRLYEQVVLEGVATWDSETWAVREFSVTRVTAYRPGGVGDAFRALAEVSGGVWDQVDAFDFVRKIRGEAH